MLMSSKREVTFSVTAIAAVIVLFTSAPLTANQQTQAQMFGRFTGFHSGFGPGFDILNSSLGLGTYVII
jgi:zinc transporter ZupT